MKTVSISVQNLCVPCRNRCRYCLLSWDGKLPGINYERSMAYALRFYQWLQENRPEVAFTFYWGYSMEHPQLLDAIDFLNSIGSVSGKFLQFDGMEFRDERQLHAFLTALKGHGIQLIDLTFYGTRTYHDRFAGREGDFDYMLSILQVANQVGLDVEAGIALSHENAGQAAELLTILGKYRLTRTFCFIPHGEGRGISLDKVRFTQADFDSLPEAVRKCLNTNIFKSEGKWVTEGGFAVPENRALTLSLTPDSIERLERQDFRETIAELEELDDRYYQAVPSLEELVKRYGDPNGMAWYSQRDLYLHYQRQYIREHQLDIYDVNDERQSFSRRF